MKRPKPFSGAKERANHPEGEAFNRFFTKLLLEGTGSCWERDILRDNVEILWKSWKEKAGPTVTTKCMNCLGTRFVGIDTLCPACEGAGVI